MKQKTRFLSSIAMSALLAILPAIDAFAVNRYQTYEGVDSINSKVIFPGDSIDTDMAVFIGPDGVQADTSMGSWTNLNPDLAYKTIVNTEENSLWLEPVGTVVTVVNGISFSEEIQEDTHFSPQFADELSEKTNTAYYPEFTLVNVKANDPEEGMVFDHWQQTGSMEGLVSDVQELTFQILDKSVILEAVYMPAVMEPVMEEMPEEPSYEEDMNAEASYEENLYEETPYDDTPYEETPYEDTYEETPNEEAPYEENTYEETPYEENAYEEALYEENTYEETPNEENAYEETPNEENAYEETPNEENTYEETPNEENAYEETPNEENTYEEIPNEENTYEEIPNEENVYVETPYEENTYEETPNEENTYEEIPNEENVYVETPIEENTYEEAPQEDIQAEEISVEDLEMTDPAPEGDQTIDLAESVQIEEISDDSIKADHFEQIEEQDVESSFGFSDDAGFEITVSDEYSDSQQNANDESQSVSDHEKDDDTLSATETAKQDDVIVETPAMTEASVIEQAPPAMTEAPVMEQTPAMTEAPVMEQAPVMTETPAIEQAPVMTEAPIEQAPAMTEAPVMEQAPAMTEAPVMEQAPAMTEATVMEQAPAMTEALVMTEESVADIQADGDPELIEPADDMAEKYELQTDGSDTVSFPKRKPLADGSYEAKENSTVKIKAIEIDGMMFDHWTVTRTDNGKTLPVTENDTDYLLASFVMPSSDVYIEAIYEEEDPEEEQFEVVVTNGSGSGFYYEGKKVKITADPPAEGYRFKTWVVESGNVFLENAGASTTKFVMGYEAVTLKATYELIPYTLTVTSGNGTGTYHKGDAVSIAAAWPADGKEFASWSVTTGNAVVTAPDRFYASLTMPAADVAVSASYKDGPSPIYNSIGGIDNGAEYLRESTITFSASGNGMENTNPNPGDFRWRPSGYSIGSVARDFTNGYTVSMAINAIGQYTLYVTYVKDVFDGNTWNATSVTDTKSVNMFVVNALSVQTGDSTPIIPFIIAAAAAALIIILLIVILIRRRKH